MKLYLKELRKSAGYSNRDDFAAAIGVNKYTYRSWEMGTNNMSLPNACYIAEVLGCTVNDIVGMGDGSIAHYADERKVMMNSQYDDMNELGKSKAVVCVDELHSDPRYLKRQAAPGIQRGEVEQIA